MTFGEKLLRLMDEQNLNLRALGERVPCNPGYLSKISRGIQPPSLGIAARLDDILGAGGELIAARAPGRNDDEYERLVYVARHPARLDAAVVDGLAATLASQRRLEDVIGSAAVLESAKSNLTLVLRLLREAGGPHTQRLAAVASETSQFTGWLHKALGRHSEAGNLYDQALRLGAQAKENDLSATALSMRGHLAWAEGAVGDMAALSEAAADLATTAGTRAVATQQQGRALALAGEREGALRAIGRAEEILETARGTARTGCTSTTRPIWPCSAG